MTQQKLFKPVRARKPNTVRVAAYDAGNLASARLILEDVGRWGGEECALVTWSRLVVPRLEVTTIDPAA